MTENCLGVRSNRAVSKVVGVALMIVIVVLLAATVATMTTGMASEQTPDEPEFEESDEESDESDESDEGDTDESDESDEEAEAESDDESDESDDREFNGSGLITTVESDGEPVDGQSVDLHEGSTTWGATLESGETDESGEFAAGVPSDQAITVVVNDPTGDTVVSVDPEQTKEITIDIGD